MRIITDEARIAKGARLGKIATFVGLGFLIGGLVISLALQDTPLLWLSFACLVLGLVISSVGTMNMNRWVREPRADQALVQGLKGYDDRYCLYNYVLPVPHVLLGPTGLYVFTALGQDGVIRYEDGKFRRDLNVGRFLRFMAEEGLGKPLAEADTQVETLREYLDAHDAGKEAEIQNILVFYNPRAELVLSDVPRPVAVPKTLKKAIRKQGGSTLPSDQYEQIRSLFEGGTS
jgi:hypothetical protein